MTTASTIDAGQGVLLVPRSTADAPELFAIIERDRADLREWLGWVDTQRDIGDVRRLAFFVERQFESRTGFDYAVRFQGRLVGTAGLHNVDWITRSAQIGYWLSPSARGLGVMTRAAGALSTHAFGPLGFHRLEIRCVVENTASRAVAERLNYRLEGVLKESFVLHGRFRDLALYAMTSSEWGRRP